MSLTKVSFSMIEGAPFNVLDYGADPTGVANSTAAILLAVAAGGSDCAIYFPTGTYKVTSQILISNDRVHIYGDGAYATTIMFAPTANSTLFKFEQSGTTINQGSVRNLAIRSNDNTYVKYALHFIDISGYYVSNVVIGGGVAIGNAGFWTDPTYSSYGIYIQGRDSTGFNEITCFADKPIVVGPNPNVGSPPVQISIDHFNFNNLFLGATYNPCVTFTTGVVATQVSFTGYQAWALGEGGFYWVDATSPGASNGLSFENVRYENNRDQSKYFINIQSASGVQNVQVSGGQFGYTNGFYLRGVQQIFLNSVYYSVAGTSGVAMNADSTCQEINLNDCYWVTGSTASLTGLQVQHQEASWTSGPLPGTGYILTSLTNSGTYTEIFETTLGSNVKVLAVDAVLGIGSSTTTGLFVVTSRNNSTALYTLNGTNNTTTEISDASGLYTPTAGNVGTLNIYWSAGNSRYEIQNKIGSEQSIQFLRIGRGQ
jgi:Pectate lyase superfamily protein